MDLKRTESCIGLSWW